MTTRWFATAISALLLVASAGGARAADLTCYCPIAMKGVVADLSPQFEQSSGHRLSLEFGTVGALADRLSKGGAADVAILSAPVMEALQKQGKLLAGSRVDIAKVGVGVFVRTGSAKPDIGSVDALKRALISAKSIGYGDPTGGGVSGIHMAALVDRLGIAAELKPKTKLLPNSQVVLGAVADGEVALGIGLTSDIGLASGVDLVGSLPAEVQNFTIYTAAVLASSKQAEAGRMLVAFLSSPAARAALKSRGFEPH
jgi:molybdate transport system substrate-binding protein